MRRCSGKHRLGYRLLAEEDETPVKVVVGRQRKEFLVDPFVLEESPFQVLIETAMKGSDHKQRRSRGGDAYDHDRGFVGENQRVIFVDVDEILFEHMLWLMHNDCSSFFKLNVREIIDFYALDY